MPSGRHPIGVGGCRPGNPKAGAVTIPIYQSSMPDECQYIASNCGAQWIFADTAAQAAKLVKVKAGLSRIRHVVQYVGEVTDPAGGWVRSMDSLRNEADPFVQDHPSAVDEAWSRLSPDDLSTIIYTSGTTGHPKGVLLTHDAFAFSAKAVLETGVVRPDEIELLFLPLAHCSPRCSRPSGFARAT